MRSRIFAYRLWRLLPGVRRHRASSPQGSYSNGAAFSGITMDQFLRASLFPHPQLVVLSSMVTHIARRVWINRERLPILHVISSTGKINISLSAFVPENFVSRDGFGSPVPRQPAHFHTQAESGAYLRDFSRVPRRRPFISFKLPYAVGSFPSLSGHAIAYRWRSLPRVHRHRAS